jgi:hypothetical protein
MIKKFLNKPIIENKISISKNGRYLIHRTIIIDITPSDYYRALLSNAIQVEEKEYNEEELEKMIREGDLK